MCCRYLLELSPDLRPIIEAAGHSALTSRMVRHLGKAFKKEGEIRPTDMAAVIAPDSQGQRKAFPMVWGFTLPGIKGPVVNARSESAASRQSFKDSWERHRCVVPASCYYEWMHYQDGNKIKTGDKYAIQPRGLNTTWLAGLYRIEEDYMGIRYPVFTVLTREPSDDMRRIHNRMPVILPDHSVGAWLNPRTSLSAVTDIVHSSLTDMIAEKTC